jgi:hypothetical protein
MWLLLVSNCVLFAQKLDKGYHLKHNIKQENEQYEFTVLDFDANGVYNYDKNKFYYWLKSQQVHATQGYSSGLLLHGEFQAFYVNKQLSKRGYFQKGLKNGEWLYWNNQGVLVQIEYWRSGIKSGVEKKYDDQGVLISKTIYKGSKTETITKDSIVFQNQRKNTKKIILFDQNHEKSKVIRLKNNLLDGKQENFKDGKSDGVEYYEKGKLLEKVPFGTKLKKLRLKKGDKTDSKDKDSKKEKKGSTSKESKNKKDSKGKDTKGKDKRKWNLFSKDKKSSKK